MFSAAHTEKLYAGKPECRDFGRIAGEGEDMERIEQGARKYQEVAPAGARKIVGAQKPDAK